MSGFGFVPEAGADFSLLSLALLKDIFCCFVEFEQISPLWKVIKNRVDWRRNKWFNHVTTAAQVGFYHLHLQLLTLLCNAGLLSSMHRHSLHLLCGGLMSVPHMAKAGFGCPGCHMRQGTFPQQTHIPCAVETSFMQVENVWKLPGLMLWLCLPEQWGTRVQTRAACSEKVSVQPMSDSVCTPSDDLNPG